MLLVLTLLLLVPVVELLVIIEVGQRIGGPETLLLLIAMSVLGAWLVKTQGIGVWRRLNRQLSAGRVPANELVDGALILLAGVLMLIPGFVTDIVGLGLLIPPGRHVVRGIVLGWLTRRFRVAGVVGRQVRVVTATDRVERPPWGGGGASYPPELGP